MISWKKFLDWEMNNRGITTNAEMARVAGVERTTMGKWRLDRQGASFESVQYVLANLGYELRIVRKVKK